MNNLGIHKMVKLKKKIHTYTAFKNVTLRKKLWGALFSMGAFMWIYQNT